MINFYLLQNMYSQFSKNSVWANQESKYLLEVPPGGTSSNYISR